MAKRQYKELEVLDFIIEYTQEHLYAPSIREICEGVGLSSTSSVERYLKRLESEGKVNYIPKSPRTIGIIGYKVVKDDM